MRVLHTATVYASEWPGGVNGEAVRRLKWPLDVNGRRYAELHYVVDGFVHGWAFIDQDADEPVVFLSQAFDIRKPCWVPLLSWLKVQFDPVPATIADAPMPTFSRFRSDSVELLFSLLLLLICFVCWLFL